MVIECLNEMFAKLEDPRSLRNQKHPFLSVISIALLASIAGITSFSGMGDFAECHEDELKGLFPLPHGAPRHDTFQRIFESIDPTAFIKCFMLFSQHLSEAIKGLTSIDGKTIRNSGKKGSPLHIVSAWCEENRLVLGHVKAEKTAGSELGAIKELLSLLDLQGRIITIDALGCQREISAQITEKEADYVLALKRNQKSLYDDVSLYFQDTDKLDGTSWKEVDKGHGRIEKRECWALPVDNWLLAEHAWPGIKSIAMVKSTRIMKDKESHDTRFYISSLSPDAEMICKIARRHWGIENKLHWVLDVIFNEDKACIRNDNAAENVDILRKWALNVINIQRKENVSIKSIQRKSAMSFKYLKQLMFNIFHA